MTDNISIYLGLIASWLAIFAVLDQLCNIEAKTKIRGFFDNITYDHNSWAEDYLSQFESFFSEKKSYIRVLFVSVFIFFSLTLFGFLLGKIEVMQLFEVVNSIILISALILVIDYYAIKPPFIFFGVGFNNYKHMYFSYIILPVLGVIAFIILLPSLIATIFTDYISSEFHHSVVIISLLFMVNFYTDYLAIYVTKYYLKKYIKKKNSLIMIVLYDTLVKVLLYLTGGIIVSILFLYYSRNSGFHEIFRRYDLVFSSLSEDYFTNELIEIYNGRILKEYYIYAVISLYSTLFSSIWIVGFALVKYSLILLERYKHFYFNFRPYVKLENVFTILGVITLPVFLLLMFIFDLAI